MKCIYRTCVEKNERCGKVAFGLLGGNSYCKKHLDKMQGSPKTVHTTPTYSAPQKGPIEAFRDFHGREPNKYELIAMI